MKKKLLSLLLAVSMLPVFAVPSAVIAEDTVTYTVTTTHLDMDFDDLTDATCSNKSTVDGKLYLETGNSSSGTFAIADSTTAMGTDGNSLQFAGAAVDKASYAVFTLNDMDTLAEAAEKGTTVTTTFTILANNPSTAAHMYIALAPANTITTSSNPATGGNKPSLCIRNKNSKTLYIGNVQGSYSSWKTVSSMDVSHTFQIVMQGAIDTDGTKTGTAGIPYWKALNYYVDGTDYLDNYLELNYLYADGAVTTTTGNDSFGTLESQYLYFYSSKSNSMTYELDNVSVVSTYETDEAPEATATPEPTAEPTATPEPTPEVPADAEFTVVSTHNFNSTDSIPDEFAGVSVTEANEVVIDTASHTNDPLYKNSINIMDISGDGTVSGNGPGFIWTFDNIYSNTGEKNLYAETEFDLKTDAISSNALAVSMGSSVQNFYINESGWRDGYSSSGEILATSGDMDEWNRYRFVMQLTDENGDPVRKITKIYRNGVDVTSTTEAAVAALAFDSTDVSKAYKTFSIRLSRAKSKNTNTWLDNMTVRTYTSEDGTSPVPEKAGLAADITELYTRLERNKIDLTDAEYASYSASIGELVEVYDYVYASTEDVAAAEADAETLLSELNVSDVVSLFSEDFEGDTHSFNGTVTEDGSYGIGNALKLTSTSATTTTAMLSRGTDMFSTSYGPETFVVTEFDVMTEDFNGNSDAQLLVSLRDSSGSDVAISRIKLDTDSINLTRGLYSNGVNDRYNRYSALEDGKWYTIRLVSRVTGSNSEAWGKTTKFYVNGNNLVSISSSDKGWDFQVSEGTYDQLAIKVRYGTAYVDNIRVTRCYGYDNEPVNYGQLLTSIRKGDKKVAQTANKTVDATVLSTYNTALNSAKAVYEAQAALSDVEVENNALCEAYADFKFKDESVKIGSVNFTDKDGNEAVYMTNSGKITGVNVTKLAEYNASGDVAVAVYNANGTLASVDFVPGALADAAVDERITVPVDVTLPADITDCTVKVMAFDSDMHPLSATHVPVNDDVTIYIAGTSMVQDYTASGHWPRQGWGYFVGDYYNDNVSVVNWALSGSTTASLIDDQRVKNIEANIKPGDYFIVSFIANDEKTGEDRPQHVEPYDYKNNLRHYGEMAQAYGANLIYVNASPRLTKNNADCYDGGTGIAHYYIDLINEVAAEFDATVLDLYDKRKEWQEEKGFDYVESAMYLANQETLVRNFSQYNGEDYSSYFVDHDGDATHFNMWGAKKLASWLAEEMQYEDCGLRYYVDTDSYWDYEDVTVVTQATLDAEAAAEAETASE